MPRYQITLAPPPEDAGGGEIWIETSFRQLAVGDDLLKVGRWVRLMSSDAPTPAGFDGAFIAATAPPAGAITVRGTMLDLYREDAKMLLTELAGNAGAPGADEAITMLERIVRNDDADGPVGDDATQSILAAADAAIQNHTASAPLIRLRGMLERLV